MIDLFYVIVGLGFLLSLLVRGWLANSYRRWSRVPNSFNLPGSAVAFEVLKRNSLLNVALTMQPGNLTDHYDPRTKTVSLSRRIYQEPSVASAAIAAHECGHAIQHHLGYGPLRLRSAILPLAQLGSEYGPWAAMGGFLVGSITLIQLGLALFTGAMVFQLLTLPVEFDASRRAKEELEALGFNSPEDREGARRVLQAAAMTYVAGAATAMGHLLIVLFIFGRGLFRRSGPTPP